MIASIELRIHAQLAHVVQQDGTVGAGVEQQRVAAVLDHRGEAPVRFELRVGGVLS